MATKVDATKFRIHIFTSTSDGKPCQFELWGLVHSRQRYLERRCHRPPGSTDLIQRTPSRRSDRQVKTASGKWPGETQNDAIT